MNPRVEDMVYRWLVDAGYEGLYQPMGECMCCLANLIDCDAPPRTCTAGYRIWPPKGTKTKFVYYICGTRDEEPWENEV